MRDPLTRRIRRFVTVADRVGLLRELPTAGPALLRTLATAGLSVRTVHALHALDAPDRPALTDRTRTLGYREADREMNRLAHGLAALGVGRRTPVVIALENRVEYLLAWFALLRLGARVVHASYRLTPPELRYLVEHSGARLGIVGEEARETARAVGLRCVHVGPAPSGEDDLRYERLVRDAVSDRPPDATAPAAESVVYTSGTTGKPKGAARDLGRFGIVELSRLLERLPLRLFDRHLVTTPLYHSGAQAMAMIATALAGEIRLADADPAGTLARLRDDRIHATFLVPTMLRRMLEHPVPALPELRAILSGAAEFPHELRMRAIRAFGAGRVFDFYGATELGWVTLADGHEMLARPGTVGRALAGQELAILDPEEGRPLPAGAHGLVAVRNAQGMEGYLHDLRSTEETRRAGFTTVEDLGRLDADGYLFLSGRARDMVKSGGVNLYPAEIEEVLLGHPSILEVAVIGVPDPEWGEALVGVVVPRGEFVAVDVEAWAKSRLAGPKVPRRWRIVDELPRNALGKVLKGELRAAPG